MSQPMTRGELSSCPCPHCGFKLDFTDVPILDPGTVLSCDSCKQFVEIKGVQSVRIIRIVPTSKPVKGLVKR